MDGIVANEGPGCDWAGGPKGVRALRVLLPSRFPNAKTAHRLKKQSVCVELSGKKKS